MTGVDASGERVTFRSRCAPIRRQPKANMRRADQGSDAAPRRWLPALLLFAFLLHNAEEAVTYGTYREPSQSLVRVTFYDHYSAPSVGAFYVALAVVSIAASLAVVWALAYPSRPTSPLLTRGLALIMLLNVILPHVPAAILLGGYAPGVLSAVTLNLPLALFTLFRYQAQKQH